MRFSKNSTKYVTFIEVHLVHVPSMRVPDTQKIYFTNLAETDILRNISQVAFLTTRDRFMSDSSRL